MGLGSVGPRWGPGGVRWGPGGVRWSPAGSGGPGGVRWNVYWHRNLRGTHCNTPLKASPNLNLSLNPNLNLTLTFDVNIGRQVILQSKNLPIGNFAVGNFAVGNFAVGNFGRCGDTVWSISLCISLYTLYYLTVFPHRWEYVKTFRLSDFHNGTSLDRTQGGGRGRGVRNARKCINLKSIKNRQAILCYLMNF